MTKQIKRYLVSLICLTPIMFGAMCLGAGRVFLTMEAVLVLSFLATTCSIFPVIILEARDTVKRFESGIYSQTQ